MAAKVEAVLTVVLALLPVLCVLPTGACGGVSGTGKMAEVLGPELLSPEPLSPAPLPNPPPKPLLQMHLATASLQRALWAFKPSVATWAGPF